MAMMSAGVRPSMRLASVPTASTWPVRLLTATTEGSLSTMPRPRTWTSVLAVPRSIPTSADQIPNTEVSRFKACGGRVRIRLGRPDDTPSGSGLPTQALHMGLAGDQEGSVDQCQDEHGVGRDGAALEPGR